MLLVIWWLCNQCRKACKMQWMTLYLIVLIHYIQCILDAAAVGIIILTHSLFIILTYAHLCILLIWTYSVLFVHCVMLLVTWWLCNHCQKACQMQWMTPYLIVLIHCIQASSYLLIYYLIVLIHCIQCVLGAAAHRLWALCSESHTHSCFWVSISCHQASRLF